MAPQGEAYHVDWIFASASNVHVANHREWFTTFTAFESYFIGGQADKDAIEVFGVGDVELEVKTHKRSSRRGKKSHHKIILRDVLYASKARCNVLGNPILQEFNCRTSRNDSKLIDTETGGSAGVLDYVNKFWKLLLVGQPLGKTSLSLDVDTTYHIRATWPEIEKARWEQQKQVASTMPTVSSSPFPSDSPDDESHEHGRYEKKGYDSTSNDEHDDEEYNRQYHADLEADLTSHIADRYFSPKQLIWIKENYLHSGNFLITQGLKFYDAKSCKRGVAIVRSSMMGTGR